MLPFLMFSSTDSPTFWPTPSVSLTSIAATSRAPQTLPAFSTASERPTCRNGCNSIRFMLLLHNFRTPRGWGFPKQARRDFSSPPAPLPTQPLAHCSPNSFRCNAYKKHRGATPLCASSANSASRRYLFSSPDLLFRSLRRYIVASLLPAVASQLSSPPKSMKRTSLLWRHTPCKLYPVTAPYRIK